MEKIILNVNGFDRPVLVEPGDMLVDTLRECFFLTGTKKGCDQGTCGSCTVLMDEKPVLGCLTPTLRCTGKKIVTIEGISSGNKLHPIQKYLVEKGGIQCGFCTPGVVMTVIPFLEENPGASLEEIKAGISGNLCRCTGYKKIIEAVVAAAEELNA